MADRKSDAAKSTKEKDKLFLSLVDMFVDVVEPDIIQMVLQNRNWDLNSAVEDIMILSNNFPTKKAGKLMNNKAFNPNNNYDASHPKPSGHINSSMIQKAGVNTSSKFDQKPKIQVIDKTSNAKCSEKRKSNCQSLLEQYSFIKTYTSAYDRTLMLIREGIKLMVVLRGPPGVGKSFLAKKILSESNIDYNDQKRHIFSSDDFFITNNVYYFVPEMLSEAHSWNQRNVSKAVKDQVSPIIVDNTNTQAWEMRVYADMAVTAGYDLEIVEPEGLGRIGESELARRNVHGVPKAKIRNMIERYEKHITPSVLLQRFQLSYSSSNKPPQVTRNSRWKDKLNNHKSNKPKKKFDEYLTSSVTKNESNVPLPEIQKSCQSGNSTLQTHNYSLSNGIAKQRQSIQKSNEGRALSKMYRNSPEKYLGSNCINSMPKLNSDNHSNSEPRSKFDLNQACQSTREKVNHLKSDGKDVQTKASHDFDLKQMSKLDMGTFDFMFETNKLLTAIGGSPSQLKVQNKDTDMFCSSMSQRELSGSLENKENQPRNSKCEDLSKSAPAADFDSNSMNEPVAASSKGPVVLTDELGSHRELINGTFELGDRLIEHSIYGNQEDTSKDYVLVTKDDYIYQRSNFQPLNSSSNQKILGSVSNVGEHKIALQTNMTETQEFASKCILSCAQQPELPCGDLNKESERVVENTTKPNEVLQLTETQNLEIDQFVPRDTYEDSEPNKLAEVFEVIRIKSNSTEEELKQTKSQADIKEIMDDILNSLASNVQKISTSNNSLNHSAKNYKDLNTNTAVLDNQRDTDLSWSQSENSSNQQQYPQDTLPSKPQRNLHRQKVFSNIVKEEEKTALQFSSWDAVSNQFNDWTNTYETMQKSFEKKDDILPQRINNPRRLRLTDSSTNTNYLDFSLCNETSPEGVKILIGNPKCISEGILSLKPDIAETLLLDKGTMTGEDTVTSAEAIDTTQISLLFPNIPKKYILEMIDKCQGDVDWAVDLLLDSEHSVFPEDSEDTDDDSIENTNSAAELIDTGVQQTPFLTEFSPVADNSKSCVQDQLKLKKIIESSVVFHESHYSDKILEVMKRTNPKYFNLIKGSKQVENTEQNKLVDLDNMFSTNVLENEENNEDSQSNSSESDPDSEKDESMNLVFSNDLILQLQQKFGNTCLPKSKYSSPVVKIPVSLARQLYGYLMDTIQSEMDQEQDQIEEAMMQDEEIARFLQDEYEEEDLKPQLQEIMDMEIALAMHKADQEELNKKNHNTVAAKLSQNILIEKFPQVDAKVLLEMLKAHNYSLHDTIASLTQIWGQPSSLSHHSSPLVSPTEAMAGAEGVDEEDSGGEDLLQAAQSHRDEAATYYSLRAECLNKAHEAFRSGNKAVATYYSQMAQMHKKKVDVCNSRAAACLLSNHKQGNTLDLHFLLVTEAEVVLEMFLDEIIADISQHNKKHQNVFIITGRGLRSRGGISRIKPMVIRKLQARKLPFNEVNPGMLSALVSVV